jgi:hypothetical protein
MRKRTPIWEKSWRFRRAWVWVKRFWKQELGVASALLVLISFTLKEEVNEFLRNERESLGKSEALMEKASNEWQEFVRLDNFGYRIEGMLNQKLNPENPEPRFDLSHPHPNLNRSRTYQFAVTLSDTLRLGDSAAIGRQNTEEYRKEIKELQSATDKVIGWLDDYQLASSNLALGLNDPLLGQQMVLNRIRIKAEILNGQLTSQLRWARNNLDHRTAITNWSIYVIFLFAWSLGLVLSLRGEKSKWESE